MDAIQQQDDFPLAEARELTRDLLEPDPVIYWIDFLFSMALGWAAFTVAVIAPDFSALGIAAYVVASLALYRAAIFTHELAHLKKGTFKLFRLVWNVTCGFPLLVPSFTYHGVHNDHHARDIYGTKADGEYVPFATDKPYKIITYMFLIFVLPIVFATRFLLLGPLSWLSSPLRRFVWKRASSLTIDLYYQRPVFSKRDDPTWRLQEIATSAYAWAAVALVVAGILPLKVLVLWYLATLLVFLLNSLRTLGAHAYRNPGDQLLTVPGQYLDSVDVPGNNFTTPLWAPVGLRFHATHHLFPNMPYHNTGKAQRRLTEQLSDNQLFLTATRNSLWDALRTLWRDASRATSSG